jgi:predicted CopG family antitoxin
MKKRDDLSDVIREERSRGRKQPIDVDEIKKQRVRAEEVRKIFRSGTRDELRSLLKSWGYSREEIEAAINAYDASLD